MTKDSKTRGCVLVFRKKKIKKNKKILKKVLTCVVGSGILCMLFKTTARTLTIK